MTTAEKTRTIPAPTADRTCGRCGMTTRWIPARKSSVTPPNWVLSGGEAYCLACRRELAVEEALSELGDSTAKQRAALRAAALVEFEVERDPDRRDGEIAKAIHCSAVAVGKARERLQARASA